MKKRSEEDRRQRVKHERHTQIPLCGAPVVSCPCTGSLHMSLPLGSRPRRRHLVLLGLAAHFCLSYPEKASERVTMALTPVPAQLTSEFILRYNPVTSENQNWN